MKHFINIKVVVISLVLTFISFNAKAQNSYIKENKDMAATLSKEIGILKIEKHPQVEDYTTDK